MIVFVCGACLLTVSGDPKVCEIYSREVGNCGVFIEIALRLGPKVARKCGRKVTLLYFFAVTSLQRA